MSKYVLHTVLCLVIVASLLCSCRKARTAQDETPSVTPGTQPLAASDKGTSTPTTAPEDKATPTVGAQRTNSPTATRTPEPTNTPEPTHTLEPTATSTPTPEPVVCVVQAGDTLATIADQFGVSIEAITEANDLQDLNEIEVGESLVIPGATSASMSSMPTAGTVAYLLTLDVPVVLETELEQIEDQAPGPPFTVEVSLNRTIQDPLSEQGRIYQVTGIVRNDSDEAYAVSDILVTFYDAEGFRGWFEPAIRDGKLVGGEWHWHGETEAEFAALLLAPGEEWPFSASILSLEMASFMIHPDAAPTDREPASVELSDVQVVEGGMNHVRITGMATNTSSLNIHNVTVSAVLLDRSGQIVSIGSKYVMQEDIAPGASVPFDVRIEKVPYVRYQLYAQAERDWE